jgi:hypothetical protein
VIGEFRLMSKKVSLMVALGSLAMASLACNLFKGAPTPPAPPIPVTTESVEELHQNLENAAATAESSGQFEIELTEAQLTSFLATELAKETNQSVTNPQVYLRDGQIQLFGTLVTENGQSAEGAVFFTAAVNAQGSLTVTVVKANLGGVPIPAVILDRITAQLNQSLNQQISVGGSPIVVDSLAIADGVMMVKGHKP